MDIQIPPELQWVSYLAGGEWPQGSETRTRRIGEHYQAAAEALQELIPDLSRVRGETMSVLFGETAEAAEKQFAMLFDGDYTVDKLAEGISGMGEGATNFSSEIEYSKLSIIVGLALAAAEISYSLAMSSPTLGASTAAIPVIETTTIAWIRALVAWAIRRIGEKMAELLTRTMMKRLLHEGFKESGQELAQGLLQEGIVQGIQANNGHADFRWDRFKQTAIASTVGGGAGGMTAVPMMHGMGHVSRNRITAGAKGAVTMFTAGVTGNVAGTLSVGGEFDTLSILASSTSTSLGGMKGLGRGQGGQQTDHTNPAGLPGPDAPNVGLRGDDPDGKMLDTGQQDDDGKTDSSRTPQNDSTGQSAAPAKAGLGRGGGSQTNNTTPQADSKPSSRNGERHNGVDESTDQESDETPDQADAETDTDTDAETQHAPADRDDQQHSPNPQPDNSDTADIPADEPAHTATLSPDQEVANPPAHAATTDVPQAAVAAEPVSVDPGQQVEGAHVAPEVAEDPQTTADPVQPQQAPVPEAPEQHGPPVVAAPSSSTTTVSPATPPTTPTPTPPTTPPTTPTTAEPATKPAAVKPDSKPTEPRQAPPTAQPAGPESQAASLPAARVQETAQNTAQDSGADVAPANTDSEVTETGGPRRGDQNCVFDAADDLSSHFRKQFQVDGQPTATGMPARALYQAVGSRADFATYAEIEATLRGMEPGSAAVITSAWAGDGQRQGGHAYVAVFDGKDVYLLHRGERQGWPPAWGQSAVSTTAVGYLDAQGNPVNELGARPDDLDAAIAVGDVQGTGDQAPGEQWRDVTPQSQIADEALAKRVPPVDAGDLRNPLGLMESADVRARANAAWWAGLSGPEQRALIDVHPQHIGNAEGIPPSARHEANTQLLEAQRAQLKSLRGDGHRLTRAQSKMLARLDRIHSSFADAQARAQDAGVDAPMLLAFDASEFGGHGRAVVSFGDPYRADSVSWHVPGQGTTIDRIGACMDGALDHLQATRQANPGQSVASIAWLGYDAPSGWSSWRVAGHGSAREGGAVLYSDIRGFNAARDTWAGDGSHFTDNHIFAHGYGTTTVSYAGRDGRLANDIRTVTLTDSPGAGPVRRAAEFGIGADNVYVASTSRDVPAVLAGRTPVAELSIGVDPWAESFGANRETHPQLEPPSETDVPALEPTTPAVQSTREIADEALAQRDPSVSAKDVVNPLGVAEDARTRAEANVRWWSGLSEDQRDALVKTYPAQIGNSEGIPPATRDLANRTALRIAREHVQHKLDRGEKLTKREKNHLLRMNRLDTALRTMGREAADAGIDPPLVLAFDPPAFGGDGRAVVSFGADPYLADSVSWLVPGFATTIDKLEGNMRNALNHLQSTLQENPTLAATSIAWIGYDAPNGAATGRVVGPGLARQGAEILYSDIRAFNAARDTAAGDGSHFRDNHIFAHSYGSTTASYAGRNGRLADDIRTVTLLGSPGAGPMRNASEFGIGNRNVFVASSSLDPVTGLGGRVPGQDGRFAGRGLGMDPAMKEFEAVRITAQFPASMNDGGSVGTHRSYYRYMDGDADPRVRTESLANFGRIAAGHPERLHQERHRTVVDGRTVDPAEGRALRLDSDNQSDQPGERRPWNPRWHPAEVEPSAAQVAADQALGQRIPPVGINELVTPLGDEPQAVARAQANAAWWSGLNEQQRSDLITAYPYQIGNAEGIPAADRDTANRRVLQRYLDQAAGIQAQIDAGNSPNSTQLDFLLRVNRLEHALQRAQVAAQQAGVGDPFILAFDPPAFGGDGRVLVSFGTDPYVADSVSWYVPGMGAQINKLDYLMHCALNILQSTRTESPSLSAASIAWLGYDAPNNSGTVRVGSTALAEAGGDILHADISAFNATRDAFAGDGSHFTGNHLFGHSYGSTTTCYAGRDGRLAEHVSTVTLLGSPGAGPLQQASDFGIDPRNVFVASSSRDFVTGLGGRTADSTGRLGRGLGTDPAMDTFGAQRVRAEFPASMDRKDTTATHNAYFDFQETDGPGTRQWLVTPANAVPSESLANLGRIASGHTERLDHETHRSMQERPGRLFGTRRATVEPAANRSDNQGRNWWNPRWRDGDIEVEPQHAVTEPNWTSSSSPTPHAATKAVADAALSQRIPPAGAADLVNPLGRAGEATARAEVNAQWWAGLNDTQRQALINTYPARIGNAEGIPPVARDAANRLAIKRFQEHVQSMIDRGVRPGKNDLANLLRVNRLDAALQAAAANATQAGVGGPMVLSLDPFEFGGDGRAVVSFGADPYQADSVSWLVPGFATTVDKLEGNMRNALNHVRSTVRENPTLAATSIAWIGYDAPNGMASGRVLSPKLARAGAEILYSDIRAFNVARNTLAADGSEFTGNHVFGHSYGSTTVSYAGIGGRLKNDIRTVTLLGSPGAGPMHHAGQFGLGDGNVFVASSSKDPVTGFGGRRAEQDGRFAGRGLGMDPAMDEFGAVRVTSEFPAAVNTPSTFGTHKSYHHHVSEGDGAPVRNESLANSGRIAAGRTDRLHHEGYRRVVDGRTVDPAVGRPLRLDDDTQVEHEGPRRPWNPRWRAGEIEPSEARLVADEALAQRIPPLAVDDLVHPLGRESQAVARARNNAAWWSGLSPDQQQALLQEYPHQIGNAEGIPSAVRDIANREMLRQYAERAAAVQARIDAGENISDRELDFVRRVNRLENAMQRAEVASTQAGEGHPLLLALDPGAFGGDGRALVSFGADPYTADSVSWYVPGLGSQLDKLDYIMHCALNIQQSTRAENPSLASASIAWLGYDAPNDSASARVARPGLARAGGEMLYTDISTFNAVHDAFSGDGSHFTGNHVFGHSYGSTTTGYAGAGGRLAPHITTVTLVGSPGAGPLRSAGDFGIDTRNVFVASSSRDFVTGLGGRTSDSQGRFGIGLGTDPAMDTFGGQRVSAEFPASMDRKDTLTTHNAYFDYLETDGPGTRQWLVTPQHAIRTESLTNFGRIAAGNHNDVHAELHRTVDESGSRTIEPAASRPAMRLDDDPGVMHPTDPHNRNRVPRWTRGNDCAQVLAQEVSTRTGRDIPLDAAPSRRGTSARAMFRAFGTAADFATYAQIEETLLGRPSGSMAVMASRWSGGQPVGHAYMAVHVDGRVYLFDPHTRQYSGWPPHWGQDAVAQTAVGYLRSNGEPVVKGRWYNQFAAAAIGRVQGLPDGQAHGNTDGLPAADRDTANRNALQHYRDRADHIRTKLDQFSPVSREERAFLERIDRLDLAVRQADADAARAGLQPPLVLVLDTSAFSRGGHAVISFGADPYHASRVTWHTARGSIEQLGTVTVRALDGLHTSTGAQDSATIAWIGDTSALHRDLAAFHETRRSLGEPGPFTGNHVVTHAPSSTSSASRPNPLSVAAESGAHVVAHRGASHDFPEQTRAAYTEALRQGADALECDVRLTKDGELVLIHDKTVDRTSNGTGRVGDMTLAELQALDFDGHGILTLDEFIQLAKDADRPVTLFIETKHPAQQGLKLEREVVAALERHGLANPGPDQAVRAAVISFYPDALLRVRSGAPNVPTVLLGASARYLAGVVGASAIGPSIETLRNNPELVGAAAARGLATYCWTVNNEADVQFARDLGVDWVATDHPGRTGTLVGEQTGRQEPGTAPTPTEPATDEHVRQIADDALSRRIPPVRPDELRNPMGPAEEAAARATNNARWWSGLTDEQRSAIVETYPQHIGNAEGISAADRDSANRNVLQQMREQADALQSKADRGERLSGAERKFLRRMDKLDLAIRKADSDAAQAGVDGPLLLAFDPTEFGGDGRAVLSYGADPYTADSVSWHVPGVGSTVDTLLGFNTTSALHHLQAVQQNNPGLSAASIAWVGYDAPSGWNTLRSAGHGMARTGGDILYSDIRAFNAARDTLAGDGSHFTGNHVFGYSYGSTTAGYAGQNGRFAGHVRTVSLVGSPGAGPVRTAGEFGIGADNVFVASSSRDVVTALGGRTSGSNGRVLGIGLGTDPAMDSFGAVRVTAEPSVSMNRPLTGGTHHTYFLNTEATTNLGRVAAGRTDAVTTEQHRTELSRSRHAPLLRTVEPAGDRVGGRRFWNALWRRPPNCAVTVTEELTSLFEGRTFGLDVGTSRRGVPARALFRAVGADARFATYDEVEAALLGDPSLRVAVLTSQWAGGRQGGHAYLAVKVDGQVQLYDPHTRKYSPWPPHWGQNAVTQTAVGYLQTNGDPVGPMTRDVPLQLDAADAIGKVQGPQHDPEFVQRQAEYRAQDPATRVVDTRYAEPMGDVVDNASDHARGRQLAQDLSGRYGPYRIQLSLDENLTDVVLLTGEIFNGEKKIGTIQRQFNRDPDGTLVAAHTGLVITDENLRGKGFSKSLTSELERFYVRSGIDRIELTTHDKGGFAWARRGYAWDPRTNQLQESLDRVKQSARQLRETVSDEAKAVLDQVVQQLDPSNPRLPEPIDLANLATTAEPDLGQRLLDGTGAVHGRNGVHYVKYLDPASVAPARTGLKGWLQNLFGRDSGPPRTADNCAYGVAGELSRIYPGRFDLSIPPSGTGVPAWALFQAAQSRSQFATYADIEAELLGRPAGSSAIVVSRWAADGGRQGGHAYLAVTDGRQVQLYDPRTRQYSPWPPHWGESAVDRTAVGYLDQNGDPVHPISDEPVQVSLHAADSVGDVKGHPAADDFLTRQQQYRAQDPTIRRVDSTYAQPLGQIVDSFDTDQVQQLAADLSGVYGPYRVEMFRAVAEAQTGKVIIGGAIISGDEEIGFTQQTYVRDRDGSLVAHQNVVDIPNKAFRGKGFAKAFVAQLDQYYALSGVDRVELRTEQDGGYAWARQGFSWNPDPAKLRASVDNVRNSAVRLRGQVSPEAQALLDDVMRRLDPSRPDLPEPIDLAALATTQEPHLGRDLLTNTYWSGVKYVAAADAVAPAVDTRHAEPIGDVISEAMDQDRAQRLADDLSGMYGPYRVQFSGEALPNALQLKGEIFSGARRIGEIDRIFIRDESGNLVAHHNEMTIEDEAFRGKGFSKAFLAAFDQYYTRSGVDRIELLAVRDGAYASARRGFSWDLRADELQESLDSVKAAAQRLLSSVTAEARVVLEEVIGRLEPGHPRLPEPSELANLSADGHPELGRELLRRTSWYGIKYVDEMPGSAADAVGDVQGHPDDREFLARQQEYRAQDPADRAVDSRYAEPVGEVVDNASDPQRVDQLAADLSGVYGPFRVELQRVPDEATGIAGYILSAGKQIGMIYWSYHRDAAGNLVAEHGMIEITSASHRGKGFSKALAKQLEPLYARSGVERIEMEAAWDGAYAWASWGFSWAPDPVKLQNSLDSIRNSAQKLQAQVGPEAQAVLDEVVQRLHPDHPRLPEPLDLARLTAPGHPDLGKKLLTNTNWHAVRYLDVEAVDSVGDVQGHPDAPDFAGQQQEYRSQDPASRRVDTRYAEQLREVVDSFDRDDVRQLAEDLSGQYGPYQVEFSPERIVGGERFTLQGLIRSGDTEIGYLTRKFSRDEDGNLVVENTIIRIERAEYRGQDFSKALTSELEQYYVRSGVDRIELVSKWQGSNAWARRGFTWSTDVYHLHQSLDVIRDAALRLRAHVGTEAQAVLDDIVTRLEVGHPRMPEPIDLAMLATAEEPELGRKLLDNTSVHFVKYLPGPVVADTQPSARNCAYGVADELSARYGRPFRIEVEPTRSGVPARALYEAVGSSSRFATYDQVEASLRRLGDGSSAVLTSRWTGGRSGGHAYLAVNDGGEIYLIDPTTGERTGWPPHWGQGAVDRTAVGYLDANGDAVNPLHDVPLRLGTADSVGNVKGLPAEPPTPAHVADEALGQRVLPDPGTAVENARVNATWWKGLNADQRQALIATYPVQIGNAEGVPPLARHEANTRVLHDWLEYRDGLQAKLNSDIRLGFEKKLELLRINSIEAALERGAAAAQRAGVDGPYLLRLDTGAFHGAGMAVVSFGVDPYLAESVVWNIPGRGMTIQELGPGMGTALNHATSALLEDPTASVASMTWIGYDTMLDDGGETGGDALFDDIRAFNAGRTAWSEGGIRFGDNHVFGHCLGSAVAGHAGVDARLDGEIRTVTLYGSPGLGPMNHAGEFGPGVDVYVATASTDSFTQHGGTTPGSRGDFRGGHGVDPAMDFFGAQRVTSEFPLTVMTKGGDYDIHNFYSTFVDKDAGVRNESLANFGRVIVGHIEHIQLEGHRTLVTNPDQTTKVLDPAAMRSVRLDDVAPPVADPADNCAYGVADVLSQRYGREFRITAQVTSTGVAARSLFEAVGSGAHFASYAEVAQRLRELGPGSSAVLASRWAGMRQGGHAYLAVNDGGDVYLIDRRTGERAGWPPHWGQVAVDRTAVGFLDADGNAVDPLADMPLQLAAAEAVGDVRGLPRDPDYLRRQQRYRSENRTTRVVDTRYADPLAELVDNPDPQRGQQLAEDLSGMYGPYRVEFEAEAVPGSDQVALAGVILHGNRDIGSLDRVFHRDDDGNLVVHHGLMAITDPRHRGQGFSKALSAELERFYVRSGVDRIELTSDWQGSNAWARRGFTWGPDLMNLQGALDQIKMRAADMYDRLSAEGQAELDQMLPRLEVDHPRLPEPVDIAILETDAEPNLGRRLLENVSIDMVKYLPADPLAPLGLPQHAPGTLSEGEAIAAFGDGENKLRALNEELMRDGVSAEERARALSDARNALRSWAYGLMSNRDAAEFLLRNTTNPTFDDLVARNAERGLTGDAIYEAIIDTSTHSRMAPGSLSDIETGAVYSQFELGMRALDEQMIRDGVSIEDRARILSGLRSSLRAWTRELMENRPAADWLSAHESAPTFEDLVARYEGKGLSGDDVYQAIIDGATHSHYAAGTLSDEETRTVYTTYELRMRELRDQLLRDGVSAEERARTMYGMRATIRSWTRSLMADRRAAEWLNENEPNPTFDELVERNRAKGRVGDEIYEAIVASSTRSRGSVNADLGIDPDNPPDLPPMRGPHDDRPQDQEEDTT